ncbi:MAG: apolipoprotein N-acyltransferase [Methylococcales bacterium]|nr:apolipoprotein N-acyltransferase [Methylococcales bacterium]
MSFVSKWCWELFLPFTGLLLTLSFAPFNYSYLALVSLVFIFFSWLNVSPFRAALRGYLFGLGLFASGISWVYISIHDYGGAPAIGAALLTGLVICFWAIFPALTAYLSVKLTAKKNKDKLIWVIPFIWILIEYYRGYWLLNGFPWLQIAYTQLDTPLKGFVPILGVYGTGFLFAITASIIVAGFKQYLKYSYALVLVLCMWGTGAYLQTIKWTEKVGKSITVSLIQGNIAQDQKWLPKNRIKTLVKYHKMTAQNWDSDIIIWPETAIPAFLSQVQKIFLDPLSAQAKANNTDLIVSLPTKNQNNEYFNVVLTLGKQEGRYNKNHLLPFGEYLPLQPVSGFILKSLGIQLGTFTSGGNDQKLLVAGGYPFATSICYEDAFGGEAIRSLPEAAFLVNVTNDAWFGDSIEPHQHMQLAQMRALETGRYMLRTTNTGMTAIVAPDGQIIKKAPMFKQAVLTGNIFPMTGMTPYARLGDGRIILILAICLLLLLLWIKRK